jgi:hypothetical protein
MAAAAFPNLDAPIWDIVRIPPRRTAAEIGDAMCAEAGLDRDMVRHNHHFGSAGIPPEVRRLREAICAAMLDNGLAPFAAAKWFVGFEVRSILRMATEHRRLLAIEADE